METLDASTLDVIEVTVLLSAISQTLFDFGATMGLELLAHVGEAKQGGGVWLGATPL